MERLSLRLDGLYRASRRKVHGFCQPDRPATEQEARGSRPGERTRVHHTASVFCVTVEGGTIRAAVLMGLRARRVGFEKDTWGAHVKYIILDDKTGKNSAKCSNGYLGEPAPKRAVRASARDQGISRYWPRAGAGGQGRHVGNT